jgi:hypothetical protein
LIVGWLRAQAPISASIPLNPFGRPAVALSDGLQGFLKSVGLAAQRQTSICTEGLASPEELEMLATELAPNGRIQRQRHLA